MAPATRPRRAGFLIWLAFLTFGLPEIIAGTSNLWLTTAGTWILTIPLYFLHFMFLVQVALITRRRSWPALYLLGVLFGLYESWITKVLWTGYPGEGALSFGGSGLHEWLALLLFYHPVMSFLLPLAFLGWLVPAWARAFPAPGWIFGPGAAARARRIALLLLLAPITATNDPDPMVFLATWLPFLLVAVLGWIWLGRTGALNDARVSGPHVGRVGRAMLVLGLVVLYGASWQGLRPEAIARPGGILATAALYPLLMAMIWRTRPAEKIAPAPPSALSAALPFRWLAALFATGLALNLLAAAGIGLREAMALVSFLGMMPLGAVLFVWLGLWRALVRRG